MAQVVVFVQETTGVNFSLRRKDLPRDGAPVTLAVDTTLENGLNRIADLTGMAWKVDGGLVKIGSPAALATHEMRGYNVADLLVSAEGRTQGRTAEPDIGALATRAENLVLLIKQACGEGTWEAPGRGPMVVPVREGPASGRAGATRPYSSAVGARRMQ
ncbi:MAG: hypothetical protein GXY85_02550 [Candidatus Brocadiaceae bacterium]|nr:hypothetical protein [Candidatus Brocadiaceae bacterium]